MAVGPPTTTADDTRGIKCGLKRICADDEITTSFPDKVHRTSCILIEVSRLMNLYLLSHCTKDRGVRSSCTTTKRVHEIDESFLDRAVQLVSNLTRYKKPLKPCQNAEMAAARAELERVFHQDYCVCRPPSFQVTERDNIAAIVLSARRKLIMNAQLHVCTHFESRTRKWIRFQILRFLSPTRNDGDHTCKVSRLTNLQGQTRQAEHKQAKKAVWELTTMIYSKGMGLLTDEEARVNDDNLSKWHESYPKANTCPAAAANLSRDVCLLTSQMCGVMQTIMEECEIPSATAANLKDYWFRYIPWMHRILQDFTQWHAEASLQATRPAAKYDPRKEKKNEPSDECKHKCSLKKKGDAHNHNNHHNRNDASSIKGLKLFTLFPEHKIRPMYIHIDNTAAILLESALFKDEKKADKRETKAAAVAAEKALLKTMTRKEQNEYKAKQTEKKKKSREEKMQLKEEQDKRKGAAKIAREEKKLLNDQKKKDKEAGLKKVLVRKPKRTKQQIALDEKAALERKIAAAKAKDLVNNENHDVWAKLLKLDKLPRSGRSSQFAYSISTDGYAATVHVRKGYGAAGNPSTNKKKKRQTRQQKVAETKTEGKCESQSKKSECKDGGKTRLKAASAAKTTKACSRQQEDKSKKKNKEAEEESIATNMPRSAAPIDLRGKRIIGLDPGRRDMFVAVEAHEVQAPDGKTITITRRIVRCSNRRWQHISGTQHALQQQKKWTAEAGLKRILLNMPSSRVHTVEAYKTYLTYHLLHMHRLMNFRSTRQQKKLRWNTKQKRVRALDKLCLELTQGNGRDIVVAYGAACASGCSPGYAPAPNRGFHKCLTKHCSAVVPTDEYLTSQICSCCEQRSLEAPRHLQVAIRCDYRKPQPNGSRRIFSKRMRRSKLGKDGQYTITREECDRNGLEPGPAHQQGGVRMEKPQFTEIHGVRMCTTCHIKWNRDVNAALNIRHAFLHMNAHRGERPLCMRRPMTRTVIAPTTLATTTTVAASCVSTCKSTATSSERIVKKHPTSTIQQIYSRRGNDFPAKSF